jgi:asparagine synthase (glutamine-hydrolysing)
MAVDRLGEKPLYYGQRPGEFFFASESRAFRVLPGWSPTVDRNVLGMYLRYGSVPAPYAIYEGVRKLEPGTMLEVRFESSQPVIRLSRYYDLPAKARVAASHRFSGSAQEAVDELDSRLRQVVARQMVSDVPLGAFLSGGVDSSSIVAIMQAQSNRPVKTFTIGFASREHDETQDARRVAEHLGTEHTELRLEWNDALAMIPRLPEFWSEPFADASQIPTLLVSELARSQVTVSLSGDAGDELFGGYNRHVWANGTGRTLNTLPPVLRRVMAAGLNALPPSLWSTLFETINPALPNALRVRPAGEKIGKLAKGLGARSTVDLYRKLVSHWEHPERLIFGLTEPHGWLEGAASWGPDQDPAETMMLIDMMQYLPSDILTKVDRASMAVSLESRVPFLDHELVEFALSLPTSYKIRDNQGKWVLRQVLDRYVPRALIDRPKMGFAVPLSSWLRGPLRDWAEELLDESRLRREGYFAPAPIRKAWEHHLSGRRNEQNALWTVLMFQAWLQKGEHPGGVSVT